MQSQNSKAKNSTIKSKKVGDITSIVITEAQFIELCFMLRPFYGKKKIAAALKAKFIPAIHRNMNNDVVFKRFGVLTDTLVVEVNGHRLVDKYERR